MSGYTGSYNEVIAITSATGSITINLDPSAQVVKFYANLRTDSTGGYEFDSLYAVFNGGTTGDYCWQQLYGVASEFASAASILDTNYIQLWTVPCDQGYNDIRLSGIAEAVLINYNNTSIFKTISGNSYLPIPSYLFYNAGTWLSTDAITSITIASEYGGNIAPGSVIYVVYQY